ncbi:MAG: hypothetical protein ACLPWS_07680 [Rhodomicrobium sp.]
MADYFTQTVVQQTIPLADMTPLELLVLKGIFESESVNGELYFFSEQGMNDVLSFDPAELREALEQSKDAPSSIYDAVKGELDGADPNAEEIELDLSVTGWEPIFQDIVKRSKTLNYISVMAAFTCSRMRADGFGGMAILITPQEIRGKSTSDLLEEFLNEAKL